MKKIFLTVALILCLSAIPALANQYPPVAPQDRLVGIAYSTWHTMARWGHDWGTPLLGRYASSDPRIIRQHAKWLANAGVDFIWIDWSNNIKYHYNPKKKNPTFDMIEGATHDIFDIYAQMRAHGQKTPNISIFAGVTGEPAAATNGLLQRKVDQIYNQYVANRRFSSLMQLYLGKPLLVIYVNTPSPWQHGTPHFNDPRFTIRWMTGYVTQQRALRNGEVSKYGYWSWEDRGPQTYTVHNGHPEAMVINAATRKDGTRIPAVGRRNGQTFIKDWERADKIGPKFAMVVSWNEWSSGEQPSAEVSKDIEPSKKWGMKYLDLMKQQIAIFKGRWALQEKRQDAKSAKMPRRNQNKA